MTKNKILWKRNSNGFVVEQEEEEGNHDDDDDIEEILRMMSVLASIYPASVATLTS